jgi:hypothetical protein
LVEALEQSDRRLSEVIRERDALVLSTDDEAALALGREVLAKRAKAKADRALARRTAQCRAVRIESDLTPWMRQAIRRVAGARLASIPVVLAKSGAPRLEGRVGHYRTEAGAVCRYPKAYRRAGGRVHHADSTQQVLVGAGWIRAHARQLASA